MGKITVLDEQLANQIAAGEVVERPSSVVKELVENAIDAGSSTIDIVIEEGGLALIRVTDNGAGIDAEDMEPAFFRHATSKIKSDKDLFRIASLGFRGEALPSIAAVAKVECLSAVDESGLGRRMLIEGGTVRALEEANVPQGTDITVRDLFFNTPARLKYMKSIQTEIGHIADYVNRLALAHPGIAFTLKHNGNSLLRTLGSGDRLQAFAAVYGSSAAKAMLPVEGEHPDYDLSGYISKPEQTRANRNGITIVVNGRYIKSFMINQAILQAYHTLLPINRFPMVVLELAMHPSLLDVNVHPSKMEVRFSKEAELKTFIEASLKQVLGNQRHIPGPAAPKERSKPFYIQDQISFHRPDPEAPPEAKTAMEPYSANSGWNGERKPKYGQQHQTGYNGYNAGVPQAVPRDAAERLYAPAASAAPSAASPAAPSAALAPPQPSLSYERAWPEQVKEVPEWTEERASAAEPAKSGSGAAQTASGHEPPLTAEAQAQNAALQHGQEDRAQQAALPAESRLTAEQQADGIGQAGGPEKSGHEHREKREKGTEQSEFPEMYWIGQLHGTYIVAQNEDGLYLIDQHAAHERINYEYFFDKFGRPEQASQQLLVPITLEFTAAEASALRGKLELLLDAGLELEPFGSNAFLVRSCPEWLPRGDEQAIIEEMTEWLLQEKGAVHIGKIREKSAIMCACKASIKANDRISREEGEVLLARLAACRQPYTCPHGRPIIVHMSTYQLEKMFKRVMS